MYNTNYRCEGLTIDIKFIGESKEYDCCYWSRLCGIKNLSKPELDHIVSELTDIIHKYYNRNRLQDIEDTKKNNLDQYKRLQGPDSNDKGLDNMDNFLE